MRDEGLDDLAVRAGRALRYPHHLRLAWPIDVGIEQPHPPPGARQRHRKVRGDSRFPHPALAAGNRDDPVDPGNPLRPALLRRRVLADFQRRRFRRRPMRRHHHLNRCHPRQRLQPRLGLRLSGAQRTRLIRRGSLDHEPHGIAVDCQRTNQVAAHQIAPVRQGNPRQNPYHCLTIDCHRFPRAQNFH
jgi:hypothetical protein